MVESGRTTRSAEEWEMSRSCQRALFSKPTAALARRMRAIPERRSARMGLRLWGIAEEPFWPRPKGSASSLRSEEHTSELQSRQYLVCRLLLEKKKTLNYQKTNIS